MADSFSLPASLYPMDSDAAASLLSLSIAAATAAPIPVQHTPSSTESLTDSLPNPPQLQVSSSIGSTHKTHRRLASTGKTRRRLSDAREAASRPSPAMLHASPPALSLASLSLSTSPPSTNNHVSTSLTSASKALAPSAGPQPVPLNDGSNTLHTTTSASVPSDPKPIPISTGKKRGVEHKCESCSKIYRHPSCLIKHRWEHTPHWREASKFVLSKHQQVQLLEAAAILSHLSPTSSSLPDDRSLWPSFLSGGSLPPPDPSTLMSSSKTSAASTIATATATAANGSTGSGTGAVSSSVPATTGYTRSPSIGLGPGGGPRMHDYAIPVGTTTSSSSAGTSGGVTQLRPGLLGVPTTTTTTTTTTATNGNGNVPISGGTPQPMSVPITTTTSSHSHSQSWSSGAGGGGTGGWSLPRSSVRSISGSSRSRSGSASDDENDHDDDGMEDNESGDESSFSRRYTRSRGYGYGGYSHHRTQPRMWKREEDTDMSNGVGSFGGRWSLREEDEYEKTVPPVKSVKEEKEWDGMEMEMDMD